MQIPSVTGMRADLILFEESPLQNRRALLGPKTILKDGVEWRG